MSMNIVVSVTCVCMYGTDFALKMPLQGVKRIFKQVAGMLPPLLLVQIADL